jgi:rod shape-determining protein MreC
VRRNRARLLVAALIGGQLFLLSAQARSASGSTVLERAWLGLVAPLARLVDSGGDLVAGAREAVRSRRALERENAEMRAELVELRRDRLRLAGLALEVEELARGSGLAGAGTGFELRPARVVHFDRRSHLRTMVIDAGPAGARRDQPVVAEGGLVGRVVETSGRWAKVQLLTDRAAAAGVVIEGARRQGILRGAGPGRLEIDFVPRQTEIAAGDRVATAGIDGVYPRGLPVGVIESVEPGSEIFHRITVRPAVDFSNLSLVWLIERERPPAVLAPGASAGAGR